MSISNSKAVDAQSGHESVYVFQPPCCTSSVILVRKFLELGLQVPFDAKTFYLGLGERFTLR